jgi:hypothetical protein
MNTITSSLHADLGVCPTALVSRSASCFAVAVYNHASLIDAM